MNKLKISVACCTYNGEQYIAAQLESMQAQTRLPDEVIVCDDGSTDNTVAIVEAFAKQSPFAVKVFRNESKPLGSSKNFEKAITLCSHELIALADQDDVWMPEKLNKLSAAFDAGVGLVFSNALVVDEQLNSKGFTLFESLAVRKAECDLIQLGKPTEVLLRRNLVTGAGMAFLSKFKPLVLPVSDNWVHDGWIALLISTQADVVMLQEPLFLYRQHSKNQIGARKFSITGAMQFVRKVGSGYYVSQLQGYRDAYSRLQKAMPEFPHSQLASLFRGHIAHLDVRSKIADKRCSTILQLFLELLKWRYHRYSRGFVTFARDMVLLFSRE